MFNIYLRKNISPNLNLHKILKVEQKKILLDLVQLYRIREFTRTGNDLLDLEVMHSVLNKKAHKKKSGLENLFLY